MVLLRPAYDVLDHLRRFLVHSPAVFTPSATGKEKPLKGPHGELRVLIIDAVYVQRVTDLCQIVLQICNRCSRCTGSDLSPKLMMGVVVARLQDHVFCKGEKFAIGVPECHVPRDHAPVVLFEIFPAEHLAGILVAMAVQEVTVDMCRNPQGVLTSFRRCKNVRAHVAMPGDLCSIEGISADKTVEKFHERGILVVGILMDARLLVNDLNSDRVVVWVVALPLPAGMVDLSVVLHELDHVSVKIHQVMNFRTAADKGVDARSNTRLGLVVGAGVMDDKQLNVSGGTRLRRGSTRASHPDGLQINGKLVCGKGIWRPFLLDAIAESGELNRGIDGGGVNHSSQEAHSHFERVIHPVR